jgi:hypothetical protein
LISLLLTACGGGDGGSSATRVEAVTDTVEGVERLSYPESGVPALAWAFDTTALIGGYMVDDPDYQFGRLRPDWLAADDSGNLYVFDSDAIRVLGYGPDGELIGRWGREGEGPGEIAAGFGVGSIAVGPADTLWIADRPNQRFTLIPLAADASPTSIPLTEDSEGFTMVRQLVVDSLGPIGQMSSFVFDREADTRPPEILVRFRRVNDDLSRDTIYSATPNHLKIAQFSSGGREMFFSIGMQFEPQLSWAHFSDGGLAVQDGAEYEIRLLEPDGSLQRIIRRAPAPRPTTDADRQAVIDRVLAPPEDGTGNGDDAGAAELRQARADALYFAEVIPRIIELRIDAQDRLWVGVAGSEPSEVGRIDVYDRDGTLLGELADLPMPARFFGRDRAVVLGEDELDVQQIKILRLVEDPEALESAAGAAAD